MKTKIYLNLTNGLEYLPQVDGDYSVIRIQSTACEQKRWEFIINDLDYDFLFNLAIGNKCIVVDYSARKTIPRSLYQGLEWVRFVLEKVWFDREYEAICRNVPVKNYFIEEYRKLDKATLLKVKYFRKFLLTDKLNLGIITGTTKHDSDYNFYKGVVQNGK